MDMATKRRKKRKYNTFKLIYIAFVLGVSMLLSAWIIMSVNELLALARPDYEVIIEIPENASHGDVAKILKKNDIIEHRVLFTMFATVSKRGVEYPAGEYKINSNMDYRAMLRRLTSKKGQLNTVMVTIPEGYEVSQIVDLLVEKGVCERDELEDVVANTDFDYEFLKELPLGKSNRLEGYLFPDTYFIEIGMSEHDMIDMCLAQFDKVYTEEYSARAKELGFTDHEIMTLASIIEKECKTDRELVSSVFHNRLKSSQFKYLESCATVIYVTRQPKDRLTYADINVKSPYNTYITPGLPPGPIASAGAAAIHAALYPAESEYYYFSDAGDGTNSFSVTYEEHLSKNP